MTKTAAAVKRGADLVVGDVLHVLGNDRTITRIAPYPMPSAIDVIDERWRIAWSGDRWSITIDPDAWYRQHEAGAWAPAHHVRPDGTWHRP